MKREDTGKVRHDTEGAAWAHVRDLVGKGKAELRRWNVYQCKSCNGWHAGHRPGTLKKDIRKALRDARPANSRNRRRRR